MTDSAAALPLHLQSRYDVVVVPFRIVIDGHEYLEGVNISPPKVVAALMDGQKVRVVEPTPGDFAAAYNALAEKGYEAAFSAHISAKIHPAVANAAEAASVARLPVTVVDTQTLAMAQGLVVLAAASVASVGRSVEEVASAAAATQAGARLHFTVATLDYVFRHGGVPRVIKSVSNVTGMRPVLSVEGGEVRMIHRVRTTGAARDYTLKEMNEYIATLERPAVSASIVGGVAAEEGLVPQCPGTIVDESPGASFAAQAGPGTFVIAAAPMPAEFRA